MEFRGRWHVISTTPYPKASSAGFSLILGLLVSEGGPLARSPPRWNFSSPSFITIVKPSSNHQQAISSAKLIIPLSSASSSQANAKRRRGFSTVLPSASVSRATERVCPHPVNSVIFGPSTTHHQPSSSEPLTSKLAKTAHRGTAGIYPIRLLQTSSCRHPPIPLVNLPRQGRDDPSSVT